MQLEIDATCGEVPVHWKEWLKDFKPQGVAPLHSANGIFYVQRVAEDVLRVTKSPLAQTFPPPTVHWGHALWKEFHETAWAGLMNLEYLRSFESRIPSLCACRVHWHKIWRENPFDPVAPKEWSVKVHNLVNVALKKSQFTLLQAEELYGTSTTTALS